MKRNVSVGLWLSSCLGPHSGHLCRVPFFHLCHVPSGTYSISPQNKTEPETPLKKLLALIILTALFGIGEGQEMDDGRIALKEAHPMALLKSVGLFLFASLDRLSKSFIFWPLISRLSSTM